MIEVSFFYVELGTSIINLKRKKRKKTEHTRMYAQLCSSASTIFTSVVVYSRTNKKNATTANDMSFDKLWHRLQWVGSINDLLLLKKRRKKRSTHACTHNCAARETKYSRRLLSILAQGNKKKESNSCDVKWYAHEILFVSEDSKIK